MDLELLNYINVDMKWTVMKKSRTGITRRPRKPGTGSFETDKAVTEKVVDAPLKKRRLSHQPPSPPSQNLFVNGEGGMSPGPQTPAVLHEDSGQRCRSNSISKSQKTKSKTRLRKSKLLRPTKKEALDLNDFSGIELLADAACSSLVLDNADDVSVLKEHTTPRVNSCNVKEEEEVKVAPSKELRLHWDLNTVIDEWEKPCDDLMVETHSQENCTEKLKLEVYDSRCNEVVVAEKRSMVDNVDTNQLSVKHDDLFGKTCELIENLTCSQEVLGIKTIASKTSDGESSVIVSKSDVVDSLIHSVKCEDFTTSTTSVLQEQTIVKVEQQPVFEEVMQGVCQSLELCKTYCDNKVSSEDPVSEGCGSNVTQDEQAEDDSEDKVQVDYDSPFEDGELREPIENPLSEDGDNIFKDDDVGSIENSLSEKVKDNHDHGQPTESQSSLLMKDVVPKNDIKQGSQADTLERSRIDEPVEDISERKDVHCELRPVGGNLLHNEESTSFDACRDFAHVRRNRSSNNGDSNSRSGRELGVEKSMGRDKVSNKDCSRNDVIGPPVDSSTRVWDLKSNHHSRNYDPRGGYRNQNRRPSPCERNNNGYSSNRGPPFRRSPSRDRYRDRSGFHSQEYRDPKPCYLDRKPRFSTHFTRPRTRSRSRSRSGSPIAWNFQKRKNLDTSNSNEVEATTKSHVVSPERSSKSIDDRRFRDFQFRERRQSPDPMTQRNRRFDQIGYPERLKSDDHFRFAQRSARFSQMTDHKYKDNSDAIRKHDGYYEKENRVGCPDDVRRFRYAGDDRRNFNSFSKDARKEHTTVIPESKS